MSDGGGEGGGDGVIWGGMNTLRKRLRAGEVRNFELERQQQLMTTL